MSYCLNPACQKPHNPGNARFCSSCGHRLLLGDRYRALQPISNSGRGRTFLGVDENEASKSRCVIKQFFPKNQGTNNPQQAGELFRQQAVQLQALGQHPQIPPVLAYFELKDWQYLVQTLIEGQSLAQELTTEGAFSETKIRQILNELLPVLHFVHDRTFIHRDINPENIIYPKAGGQLFLVDFGAAKITTKTALARTGTVIGSAAYTAPEQLIGKGAFASDIYSLGVTCIHLLTDIHPFDLFNSWEGKWVWQDYLSNPISNQLSQILNKMIAATVKDRYQSAAEILKDLNPGNPLHKNSLPEIITPVKPVASSSPNVIIETSNPPDIIPTWRCIHTLTGHSSSIISIAFSSNGQTLASGSADNTIKIWNLDGINAFSLLGHSSLINAVAFRGNGQILVSGSWDHTIKIWNCETGELLQTLDDHSGWIKSIAISFDGQILASGSADKTSKIWDFGNDDIGSGFQPPLIHTLYGHKNGVQCVAISPDRQTLISGSADETIKIWNLQTGELINTLVGHSNSVDSLTFSPSGQMLVSCSADNSIKIWHLGRGEVLRTLTGHLDAIKSVAINAQGNILISGSVDKTVKIWHPGSGELLDTLTAHSGAVTSVAISPDSRTLASGSQDKTIKLWRFE
jgi:WD40 repeat protein